MAYSGVPDDPATVTLLHFTQIAGSQTLTDEGGHYWAYNPGGDFRIVTNTSNGTWAAWRGGAAKLDNRTPLSYICAMPSESSLYDYNTINDEWTLDFWYKPSSLPSPTPQGHILNSFSNGAAGYYLYYTKPDAAGWYLNWYYTYPGYPGEGVSTVQNASPWLPNGSWSHIAVTSSKTWISIYINGTRVGANPRSSTAYPQITGTIPQFCMGQLVTTYLANGTFDEIRFTKGVSRYDPLLPTFTLKTTEYDSPYWAYPFAGTYLWTAPAGVTDVGATISGGGSGGQGGYDIGSPMRIYYAGRGGVRGYFTNNTHFKVVPGNTYTMSVGNPGLRGAYRVWGINPCVASDGVGVGGSSSIFGRTLPGGTIPSTCLNLAISGDPSTWGQESGATGNATSGAGDGHVTSGGYSGGGFGAGGGAGGQDNVDMNTYGGNGTAGLVWLYAYGSDPLQNYPNFTATPLTTTPGSVVNFTDTSVINDPTNIYYTWDFGDGTPFTHTAGNTSHVYGYAGSFNVNLSIAGGVGEMYELKENYITVTNSQATTYMVPHSVTLNLVDYNMNPLEGINVTATPQNFTAPDGWLQTYYGVAPGVALNGTTLMGVSGYDGSWVAPMLGAYRYNFTFYKTGVLNNYSFSMYPVKDEYTLKLPIIGTVVQPTPATNYISYYLYNNTVNSTAENFTIKYKDTSGGTGVMIYNITNTSGAYKANGTVDFTGVTTWINTTTVNVSHTAGESLTVRFSAPQTQVGRVNKSYTVTWDNLKTLGGYPEWVGDWVGIAVLVLFAGSVSLVSVKYAAIILPALAFFMVVYTRWLSPVIGVTTFIASLGILFTLGVLRYIRDQKGKLGRT